MIVRSLLSIILLVLFPSLSFAQLLEGEIAIAGKGRAAVGAEVSASCADLVAVSDDFGHYEFRIFRVGECRVQVSYKGKNSTLVTIYVSMQGTRASLELRPSSRGWHLSKR